MASHFKYSDVQCILLFTWSGSSLLVMQEHSGMFWQCLVDISITENVLYISYGFLGLISNRKHRRLRLFVTLK